MVFKRDFITLILLNLIKFLKYKMTLKKYDALDYVEALCSGVIEKIINETINI